MRAGRALTSSLIQRLLRAPLKPCQIRILSLCIRGPSGLLGLALFSTGVFLAPLNLLRLLAVSFCNGRFPCSSDGALLCVASRNESPIACRYAPVPSMIGTTPSLRDVFCRLRQEHGWWSLHLVQPCANECLGRTRGLPCSIPVCGYLPLRLSGWYRADLEDRAPPIEFLVSASPVLGSFSSCRLATQWIAS